MSIPLRVSDKEQGSPKLDNHNATEQPVEDAQSVTNTQGVVIDDSDDPNYDLSAPELEDESPYPEVRSAVSNTDDPTMPSSTFRAWFIGLIWVVLISGINLFFNFRYPSVYVSQIVAQVLSLPMGKAWARLLPNISLFGIPLNPGPFNIKEHTIITIMAGASEAYPYATNTIIAQKFVYNQHVPFVYQWLFIMSTQMIGFSLSGICRRFLVAPPSMIWPANLVTAALFNTMHSRGTSSTHAYGGISRQRFFFYVFIGYTIYNFFPSYLFTALSSFSWVCWIAPHNVRINQLFGVTHGLAMGILTFDWGQIISFVGTPLIFPWWSMANAGATIVLFYWILLPILYYNNVWYTSYLPVISSYVFDNTGSIYNVSRIVNPDASLNLQAYKSYSPLFISVSFDINYWLSFASISATFTHSFLYRKLFWNPARGPLCFLAGILAPLFQWILHKKFKIDFLKYINFPIIFASTGDLPPATPINFVPGVLVCFIFNYVIRRRHFDWWSKYNYVLSSALDAGYEIGTLIIFFALQYPKNGNIGLNNIQTWWGNTVYTKTDDYLGVPYKELPKGETFGPSSW